MDGLRNACISFTIYESAQLLNKYALCSSFCVVKHGARVQMGPILRFGERIPHMEWTPQRFSQLTVLAWMYSSASRGGPEIFFDNSWFMLAIDTVGHHTVWLHRYGHSNGIGVPEPKHTSPLTSYFNPIFLCENQIKNNLQHIFCVAYSTQEIFWYPNSLTHNQDHPKK